jgi:GT2 family glycosyltransferase
VVVLNYKRLKDTDRCLSSLLKTVYPDFEITLVDNSSRDGTVEYVTSHYPNVRIIEMKENLGYAGGNNVALRSIDDESKYVAIVNNDVVFDKRWLLELVKQLERDLSIGACQPKILSLLDPKRFEYNGACGGFLDFYGYPCLRGRVLDSIEEDIGQYDSVREIFWAGGCAFLLRRKILEETGLLDEAFFMHFEEIDLCWRIHLRGYKILSVPSSIVYHKGGESGISQEMMLLKYRNNVFMLLKNYGLRSLVKRVPIRVFTDITSVLKVGLAPVKAYLWIIRNFKTVWSHRVHVQENIRTIGDDVITEIMIKALVPLMYLKGYVTFSQFQEVARRRWNEMFWKD